MLLTFSFTPCVIARVSKLKDFISKHGLTTTAQATGVSAQRLSNWLERGVPVEHCSLVERATAGEVRRWDLRPNDWHRIWPELQGSDGAPDVAHSVPDAAWPHPSGRPLIDVAAAAVQE